MIIPPELSAFLEILRFPLETAGIILLMQIRSRVDNHKVRIGIVEKNLGIHYPEEFKQ